MQISEWELNFDEHGRAIDTCENCGAVYVTERQANGRYINSPVQPGVM